MGLKSEKVKKNHRPVNDQRIFYLSVMNFDEKNFDFIYGIAGIWLLFDNQTSKANR
jgi:hypothetical protein